MLADVDVVEEVVVQHDWELGRFVKDEPAWSVGFIEPVSAEFSFEVGFSKCVKSPSSFNCNPSRAELSTADRRRNAQVVEGSRCIAWRPARQGFIYPTTQEFLSFVFVLFKFNFEL